MTSSNVEIQKIEVASIRPNPYQPREKFSDSALEELSESIRAYGVLQPINVRKLSRDSYELVAGERRLRAAKLAGIEKIPAIVVDFSEEDSAIIAMIENLQREDLNFIEEAKGYKNLIEDHKLTQQEVAEKIGKSQSTIANKIRILKLSHEIQRTLLEEDLSERHGRALLKLPSDDMRQELVKEIVKNKLSVKQTEDIIQSMLDDIMNPEEKDDKKASPQPGRIKAFINTKIYLNTLKQAYKAIKDTGIDADYQEIDKEDMVEVIVRIPKK